MLAALLELPRTAERLRPGDGNSEAAARELLSFPLSFLAALLGGPGGSGTA